MVNVQLDNEDTTLIDSIIQSIATQSGYESYYPATIAVYAGFYDVTGSGFTYDASGRLSGGIISGLSYSYNFGSSSLLDPHDLSVSGLSLPVQQAIALASVPGTAAPALLAGTNTIQANTDLVTLYNGDDTVVILGPGNTPIEVNGGGGVNVAALQVLRDQAAITGGGRTETVTTADGASLPTPYQAPLSVTLVDFSELRFIDGSVFQDDATPGAQAVLAFLGILGRLPDPINAGGYALLAEQSGTAAAADQLLTTQEAQTDTAGLDNTDYVTRLYENILHRAPEPAGLTHWQSLLDSGAATRGNVAAAIAGSPEAQVVNATTFASNQVFGASPYAMLVQRLYETLLGRPAESASLDPNTQLLANDPTQRATLENSIMDSPEFASLLHGAPDDSVNFVNLLQENLSGQADPATTSYYANLLNTGQATRTQVTDVFVTSPAADAKVFPLATSQGVTHL